MIYVINTFTAISMHYQLYINQEFIGIATLRQETSIPRQSNYLATADADTHVLSHLLCRAVLSINIDNATDIHPIHPDI